MTAFSRSEAALGFLSLQISVGCADADRALYPCPTTGAGASHVAAPNPHRLTCPGTDADNVAPSLFNRCPNARSTRHHSLLSTCHAGAVAIACSLIILIFNTLNTKGKDIASIYS
ncbi:hypothetical protein [Herbaspirillum sp. RV1423]|uniref:hypothetical protein n=1 Tax=Herbaspirillum sp. RV1423 TaxID=1443993 RepID=UPI0012DBFB46|nr:hypothetical protein [Herbaspirillum sp. RV1423]